MAKRRIVNAFVLTACLGVVAWFVSLGKAHSTPTAQLEPPAAKRPLALHHREITREAEDSVWRSANSSRSRSAEPQFTSSLQVDPSGEVAEIVTLQHLATGTSLHLSPEQWSAFAQVTRRFQLIRQSYEATLAKVAELGAGHYQLEVPAYLEAGTALKSSFKEALVQSLGRSAGNEVLQLLGPQLCGHFGGFGVSQQALTFARTAGDNSIDYQITRTVTYWDDSLSTGRVVTRQETYLPAFEDPDGQLWGPYLQVLAQSASGS